MEASAHHQSPPGSGAKCPACGFQYQYAGLVCVRCGQALPQGGRLDLHEISTRTGTENGEVLGISRFGWISLAGGLAAAIAVSLVGFLTYIVSFFTILVHEMGHALAGWLFGYPSIPSFDFVYGGGVTLHQERMIVLSAAVYAAFTIGAYLFRRHLWALISLAAAAALYSWFAFTGWHEALIIGLGHGTELIIACIFLYRAMSGRSILQAAERPVYAFLGFFIVIYNAVFNYRLITDTTFRFEYEYAKGDAMTMDYSRLATEFLHTDLIAVAKLFLVLSLLVPLAGLAIHLIRLNFFSTEA